MVALGPEELLLPVECVSDCRFRIWYKVVGLYYEVTIGYDPTCQAHVGRTSPQHAG